MKIVNVIGGLGNQMFQFAFALSLQSRYPNERVLVDTSHFHYLVVKKFRGANLHNGYEIDRLFPNANLKKATATDLLRVTWYMPNYMLSRIIRRLFPKRKSEYIQNELEIFEYNPAVYEKMGDCYYEGVWESVHYILPIREKVQAIFAHSRPNRINTEYIRKMEREQSVGIHIRRGDYVYSPEFNNICDLDYYARAINVLVKDKEQHSFFIFSNDIKWCEIYIKPLLSGHQVYFVTENTGSNSCWDMFLMTHCKDLIIANSSFSWWGAFLNQRHGRVVAPITWVHRNAPVDVWLDEWIKV